MQMYGSFVGFLLNTEKSALFRLVIYILAPDTTKQPLFVLGVLPG